MKQSQLQKILPINKQNTFINTNTKVLIHSSKADIHNVSKFFTKRGVLDFAFIYDENSKIVVQKLEKFNGQLEILKNAKQAKTIFPDKLKDLQGYEYRIIWTAKSANKTNRINLRTFKLFKAISKVQNAKVKFLRQKLNLENSFNYLEGPYGLRKADFVVNKAIKREKYPNPTILYNRNSFCVTIPKIRIDEGIKFSRMIQFDRSSKILLIIMWIALPIIWRLYQGRGAYESTLDFIVKFYAIFYGQSQSFSRKNRLILKILAQILIFMTFVCSIYSQRFIGIVLSNPDSALGLESSHSIFMRKSDTILMVDSILDPIMSATDHGYQIMKQHGRVTLYQEESIDFSALNLRKMSVIGECDFIRMIASNDVYVNRAPRDLSLSYIQINGGLLNPLDKKVQKFIRYSFEGGLMEIWETMIKMKIFGQNFPKSEAAIGGGYYEDLEFEKLAPVFYLLFQCQMPCVVVFILELFYHGFIRQLSMQIMRNWATSLVFRRNKQRNWNWQKVGKIRRAWYFWRQRRNMKVRRVNVRTVKNDLR